MSLLLRHGFILVKPSLCRRIIYSLVFVHLPQLRIDIKLLKNSHKCFPCAVSDPTNSEPSRYHSRCVGAVPASACLASRITTELPLLHTSLFSLQQAKKAMVYYPDPVILSLRDYKAASHWFCFHYFFLFKINLFSSALAQFPVFQKNESIKNY